MVLTKDVTSSSNSEPLNNNSEFTGLFKFKRSVKNNEYKDNQAIGLTIIGYPFDTEVEKEDPTSSKVDITTKRNNSGNTPNRSKGSCDCDSFKKLITSFNI